MSSQSYSPEFKDEATRQVISKRILCYRRFGVSRCAQSQSYKWVKAVQPDKTKQTRPN